VGDLREKETCIHNSKLKNDLTLVVVGGVVVEVVVAFVVDIVFPGIVLLEVASADTYSKRSTCNASCNSLLKMEMIFVPGSIP
jgi:hypothetical protein